MGSSAFSLCTFLPLPLVVLRQALPAPTPTSGQLEFFVSWSQLLPSVILPLLPAVPEENLRA